MEEQSNENVTNALETYIELNKDNQSLAAQMVLEYAGNMTEKQIEASDRPGRTPFTSQSILARHKFASSQLLKLYSLTFALQAKILAPVKEGDEKKGFLEKRYYIIDGDLTTYTDAEAEELGKSVKDSKINKNHINWIRSYYDNQLTSVLPKVMHIVYSQILSTKSKSTYNSNEVRAVWVDSAFIHQALADVQQYVKASEVFDQNCKEQRSYLFKAWFNYVKASGKNSQKLGSFFLKLLSSTISRLAKEVVVIKKQGHGADSEVIGEVFSRYDQKDMKTWSCDMLYNSILRQYCNESLSSRVKAVYSLQQLAGCESIQCDNLLVRLDTLGDLSDLVDLAKVEEARVMRKLVTVSLDDFTEACNTISPTPVKGEKMPDYTIGSERLNIAIFKASNSYDQRTSSDKNSRKKISLALERVIVRSPMFYEKLIHINDVKSTSTSKRSEKQRQEHSMILSDVVYNEIATDKHIPQDHRETLLDVFADFHKDEGYGIVQKGHMFLSAASKVHNTDDKKTIKAVEGDCEEIRSCINQISFVVTVYSELGNNTEKEAEAFEHVPKGKAPPASGLSSPKGDSSKKEPTGRKLVSVTGRKLTSAAEEKPTGRKPLTSSLVSKLVKKPTAEEKKDDEVNEEQVEKAVSPKGSKAASPKGSKAATPKAVVQENTASPSMSKKTSTDGKLTLGGAAKIGSSLGKLQKAKVIAGKAAEEGVTVGKVTRDAENERNSGSESDSDKEKEN